MYSQAEAALKRAIDVGAAASGLAALTPVLLAVAAAVKLSSSGPVLFRQTRVGRDRRPFTLYKFRTMRQGATGIMVTAADDDRITRVGRILRKTKIDELPELYNVLVGDMSLVGPRPEVPEYVRRYRQEWLAAFRVRPGLTDPATIRFRREEELLRASADKDAYYVDVILPEKLRLTLEYLERANIGSDLCVMLETLHAVLRG